MKALELYAGSTRRWVYFGRDPGRMKTIIDTNQYLITNNGRGLLLDPGGLEVFPAYIPVLSREIDLADIDLLVSSHQDPDVISSLALWIDTCPNMQVYVPMPWMMFIPHLCEGKQLNRIPDKGMNLILGESQNLELIPAHYLHSSGNFSLYDPEAKILFSGDIGAAILSGDNIPIFVEDFDAHEKSMRAFHQRWMPSEAAKHAWLDRVSQLDIEMMCPQHGSIFRGDDVQRFFDWFHDLEVGQVHYD